MIPRTRPLSLGWFPYDVDDWEQRCDGLTFEEETALHRAVRKAWRDKEAPCTLVDTPSAWERLLGLKWRKLRTFLTDYFTADDETPGRLRCAWLLELRAGQLARYELRAAAGHKGGAATGAKRGSKPKPGKQTNSNATTTATSIADSPTTSRASSNAVSNAIADRRERGGATPGPSDQGGSIPPAADDAPLAPRGRVASPSARGAPALAAPNGAPSPDVIEAFRAELTGTLGKPTHRDDQAPAIETDPQIIARREQRKAAFRSRLSIASTVAAVVANSSPEDAASPPAEEPSCAG